MLDLNRILLLIACLSPVIILARTWKRAALNRGWRLAAVIVLMVTAIAWLVAPRQSGFIGGSAWLLLLFIPAVGLRRAADLAALQRYPRARRIVSLLRFLHPTAALGEERLLLRALELAQDGEQEPAVRLLDQLAGLRGRVALQAAAQSFRVRGDWEGLLTFCRNNLPLVALGRDPAVLPLFFRALGETGATDELVIQLAGRAPALFASPAHESTADTSLMTLLAFCGRPTALARLMKTRLRKLDPDTKEFWLATAEMTAGESEPSRARLERLRQKTRNVLLRAEIKQRLGATTQMARPLLTPAEEGTIRRLERHVDARRPSLLTPHRGVPTPAVLAFILLNGAMFVAEIVLGGSTNYQTLHRLGALEPFAVLARGEYWRLLGALFLHYGPLHLLFNSYALYVLGPALERSLGSARFAATYLLAGLGSSAGVVILWRVGWTQADFLVGASGSVMGVVGAWAGLLLRHQSAPLARQRLLTIVLIIAMQTAFDFITPQVSMAAHLCGLLTGLVLGLLLAPKHLDGP